MTQFTAFLKVFCSPLLANYLLMSPSPLLLLPIKDRAELPGTIIRKCLYFAA